MLMNLNKKQIMLTIVESLEDTVRDISQIIKIPQNNLQNNEQ